MGYFWGWGNVQKLFLTLLWQIEPKKVKNGPQIKSKSKDRIEGTIKNESCSTTWVDPKTVFEPHIEPVNSPLGPQNVKNNLKIKANQNWKNYRQAGAELSQAQPKLGLWILFR